ncbi:MAG: hypothetical protein HC794_07605 [Nitrospiraceae bacterium]|nr:hypothetical protein [Nitrospiraceae bacterium]
MIAAALSGGFTEAPVQAACAFRQILEAMARPGTIRQVEGATPPGPLSVAAGVALLTLTDPTTPLHLAGAADTPAVRDWVAFHIGAPLVAAENAGFALGSWDALQPVSRFKIGQPDYFCSCDHVQRERVVCYGLFRQDETADGRIIRLDVQHKERTCSDY